MESEIILEKLIAIENLLMEQKAVRKKVLTIKEACVHLGLSRSHLYKLTSKKQIPHFCPGGRRLYFKREELDNWMLQNRQKSTAELEKETLDYICRKK